MCKENKINKNRLLLIAIIIIAVYLLSYLILTLFGDYYFSQTWRCRDSEIGFTLSGIIIWQPMFCRWQANYEFADGSQGSRGDIMGYLYSPLIYLDRVIWHRTQKIPLVSE